MPLDPFAAAELEAIEAALAGREVDPEHAELAELSVLLATDQQYPDEAFTRELDARVARRFREPSAQPRSKSWIWRPAIGAGLTAALAAIVVLAVHSGTPTVLNGPATAPRFRLAKPLTTQQLSHSNAGAVSNSPVSNSAASSAKSGVASGGGGVLTPAPVPNGRRQIKSAQVTLRTSGSRIDAVAQEVFNVASRENGIVKSSQVAQGRQAGGGFAAFNLGIPTSNLRDALDQLSRLQYADVVSRT